MATTNLFDQARELGIEPLAFNGNDEALQERINHVRAEKEAVSKGQPSLTDEVNSASTEVTADGVLNTENTPSNKSKK